MRGAKQYREQMEDDGIWSPRQSAFSVKPSWLWGDCEERVVVEE